MLNEGMKDKEKMILIVVLGAAALVVLGIVLSLALTAQSDIPRVTEIEPAKPLTVDEKYNVLNSLMASESTETINASGTASARGDKEQIVESVSASSESNVQTQQEKYEVLNSLQQ